MHCDTSDLYTDGLFKLSLIFADDYPQTPISVQFSSFLYHPQVNPDNGLCQIRESTVAETLSKVKSLLHQKPPPCLKVNFNQSAAALLAQNEDKFIQKCKENAMRSHLDHKALLAPSNAVDSVLAKLVEQQQHLEPE